MKEIYTFRVNNNHPVLPKYALLLGSTINLNGELDDPHVEINIPESSHVQLKRELLTTSKNVIKLGISSSYHIFNFELIYGEIISAGRLTQKIIKIGEIKPLELKENYLTLKLEAIRYLIFKIEPKSMITLMMETDNDI